MNLSLRLIPITITEELTDEGMVKVLTMNENLKAYGYTFKPCDLVKIARSKTDVYSFVTELLPDVKAKPMYPNFPTQVMEMDEAEYRFHQLMHYFSTYGVENLFGGKVSEGWLPDVEDTEKIKDDDTLFEARILEVCEEKDFPLEVMKRVVEKKERMTKENREIVNEVIGKVDNDTLKGLTVTFKENLLDIFVAVVDNKSREDAKDILVSMCQHSGDVLKAIKYYLIRHNYKISTSYKKLFVKILESYPDFKENITNLNREQVLNTLQYLDFNTFSRSAAHKAAVAGLRNKDLRSWHSLVEKALKEDLAEAVRLLSKRPGEFLRRMNEALNRGVKADDILNNIDVTKLSLPTLVKLNTTFDSSVREENKVALVTLTRQMLYRYLCNVETPIKGKKVYIEEGMYDFANSILDTSNTFGGYIPAGIAYKIPGEARNVRFFTYWNDKKRVDLDLHAVAFNEEGEVHIGWNGDFNANGICTSGDITHSDAAEYIDVDLEKTAAKKIFLYIDDYTRYGFDRVEEVLTGLMAVKNLGEEVKLYNPKNTFFSTQLHEKCVRFSYGVIDIEKRVVKFVGKKDAKVTDIPEYNFTLLSYLNTLIAAQKGKVVETKEEADIVLRLDKGDGVSLIDNNFFLDY